MVGAADRLLWPATTLTYEPPEAAGSLQTRIGPVSMPDSASA
ncbi:hypothetical protein [Nonomuraea montanisoli]|nr:hypothetical protein [Nonomuraea montanisoli]